MRRLSISLLYVSMYLLCVCAVPTFLVVHGWCIVVHLWCIGAALLVHCWRILTGRTFKSVSTGMDSVLVKSIGTNAVSTRSVSRQTVPEPPTPLPVPVILEEVIVSRFGERFHREGCPTIPDSQGLRCSTRCRVCRPGA